MRGRERAVGDVRGERERARRSVERARQRDERARESCERASERERERESVWGGFFDKRSASGEW